MALSLLNDMNVHKQSESGTSKSQRNHNILIATTESSSDSVLIGGMNTAGAAMLMDFCLTWANAMNVATGAAVPEGTTS